MLTLGVQVSIAGKIYHAIDRAKRLQCNAMQIFARNPRQYRKSSLTEDDIALFRKKRKAAGIKTLIIHTPYTLNLGATKSFLYHATIKEFTQDIKEAHALGAQDIVIHTGSFPGDEREGLERIMRALEIVLENTSGIHIGVLLENTAGAGSSLGYSFDHHGFIFRNIRLKHRLGICLDTAHAFSAGYRINTKKGLDKLLAEIDREVGIEKLKVIHLNDTQDELGSRKDRHYHIGRGNIGKKGFRLIVNHPRLREIPFILETPKQKEADDAMNLASIRKLYKNELLKKG